MAILPNSLDLMHHLSPDTAKRAGGAMKQMGYMGAGPGWISLAGGKPQPSVFPLSASTFTIPAPEQLGDVDAWKGGKGKTIEMEVVKGGSPADGLIDIERSLQYAGRPNGFEELLAPLKQVVNLVHAPPYADFEVVLTLGCSDGVSKTWTMFTEFGVENVLCEEHTFGSSLNSAKQNRGVTFWPVEIDGLGLIPESLDKVMSTWDVEVQGKKPHMIYVVPCGQNPTGTVPSEERYVAIYKLAQKHDLIIMEDDPYFWLQYQEYNSDLEKRQARLDEAKVPLLGEKEDLAALVKGFTGFAGVRSYLSRDVDGRVVRLDTFSKIFAPGLRTGFVTCNKAFSERYFRINETSTQNPNNFVQSMLAGYLHEEQGWGVGGFLRWIHGVRLDYQRKRDYFLDSLSSVVDKKYVETVPAKGGMFQWLEIKISTHPRFEIYATPQADGSTTNTQALMEELFQACCAEKVLVFPGRLFAVEQPIPTGEKKVNVMDRSNYFRCTFAGELPTIQEGLERFGKVTTKWFEAK